MDFHTTIRKPNRYDRKTWFLVKDHGPYWKMMRKYVLKCSWCQPNRHENLKRSSRRLKRGWKETTRDLKQYEGGRRKKRWLTQSPLWFPSLVP